MLYPHDSMLAISPAVYTCADRNILYVYRATTLEGLPCRGSNNLYRSIRATTLEFYPVVVAVTCSYAYACFRVPRCHLCMHPVCKMFWILYVR